MWLVVGRACRWFGEPGFEVGDHLGEQAGVLVPHRLRAEFVDAGDLRDAYSPP
ncbi:hypothetical protein ABT294_29795 [Nonomuraea sp. NPDC000554]|uniref:hypothetical protein n=1 Tax=Nonomuraea sp. NPDC000554 TaxID=3154259 RepID=UPI003321E4A0